MYSRSSQEHWETEGGRESSKGGELTIEGIAERERNLPKPQKRLGLGVKKKKKKGRSTTAFPMGRS